jgi:hypothetical protein
MTKRKEMVERRKHKRFQGREGALAALGPHSTRIGQIIDVSMGGLAFSYIAGEEPSDGSFELGILFAEESFYLTQIPFKTISDQEAKEVPFSFVKMRRCGVQFGEMTHSQISQVEYFIQNYTMGGA